MKTKEQKKEQIKSGEAELAKSETVVVTDFNGLTANDMNAFRKTVRAIGGVVMVMKKRLLKLVFAAKGIEFNPKDFAGQAGVIFLRKISWRRRASSTSSASLLLKKHLQNPGRF